MTETPSNGRCEVAHRTTREGAGRWGEGNDVIWFIEIQRVGSRASEKSKNLKFAISLKGRSLYLYVQYQSISSSSKMKLINIITLSILSHFVSSSPVCYTPPPSCSQETIEGACTCSHDMPYQRSRSTITLGAKIEDVSAIMKNFHQTAWIGVPHPISVSGTDLTPGAVRVMPANGVEFVEQIYNMATQPDGSFNLALQQADRPMFYWNTSDHQMIFDGFWDSMTVTKVSEHETAVDWRAWGCINQPSGFSVFQREALKGVVKTLSEARQLDERKTSERVTKVVPPEWEDVNCCYQNKGNGTAAREPVSPARSRLRVRTERQIVDGY
ncbi:hypothetical protein EJ05DRAFT_94738 [Pseudovirgaria hyperparasitica]|uniref:Uncharacterized protein n=1 Tax=Pseudovirgaria hyperparasitica TaxID=470096 RepID=A0A6A6W116_9PEZI|nr:uncharacterized protein EJ05DRAFT_94738 [Pseudovirgaria hyperparasitica]KAF2756233.1 hypothetical protein EJ05DRAFT_94738 [Pseudovirgaria hyperparasitica]